MCLKIARVDPCVCLDWGAPCAPLWPVLMECTWWWRCCSDLADTVTVPYQGPLYHGEQCLLSRLLLAQSCKRYSHAPESHIPQFQTTPHVAGCNSSAGIMVPCVLACILMGTNVRMLWHIGRPLLQDGRTVKSDFIPGTVMVWSMKLRISRFKWRWMILVDSCHSWCICLLQIVGPH